MKRTKYPGQGLVEFAFLLPVLVLIFLGIAEGAHVMQAYLALQNGARQAARYAVSGQPLNQFGDPWTFPADERLKFIKEEAIKASIGTGYTTVITDVTQYDTYRDDATCDESCAGVIAVRVDAVKYDSEGNLILSEIKEDDPGSEGSDVMVSMYHNVILWDPIYSAIVPNGYLRLEAQVVMRNEGGKPIAGSPPTPEGGKSGPPGTGGTPGSSPLLEIQGGNSHPAGTVIFIRLRFHTAGTPYEVYVDNVYVGTVTTDGEGNAILSYTIPLDKPAGSYTVESRALNGSPVTDTVLVVIKSLSPAIITNGDVWPLGSLLTYDLVSHQANTTYNIELVKGSTTKSLPALSTDPDGNSTASGSYLIPNDGSVAPGVWTIRSLHSISGTVAATRTLTLQQACIKLNQGDCGETITLPNGVYLSILLDLHAYNRPYIVKFVRPDSSEVVINPNLLTDANGQAQVTYLIPATEANGTYSIITEDAANPGWTIAKTDLILDTPTNAFIHVEGGYTWPAGSTILYQLRNHTPSTQYDIYWEDSLINDTADPTDGNGSVWLQYTIPISIQGVYHLQSKPHNAPGGTPYTAVSQDITVTPSPYLQIAEGMPQIPGAPVTILLKNHAINGLYDVYVLEDITACDPADASGRKLPNSPVTTDGNGHGSIPYDIPANIQGKVHIRSYVKGTTTNPVADLCLDLVTADLQVTSIEFPKAPKFNSDVPITVTIINASPVTITHHSFDVDLYLDPPQTPDLGRSLPPGDVKVWIQPPLAYSQTRTFTTTLPIYGAFDHRIWARADTSDRIAEGSLENNNLLSALLTPATCQAELDASVFDPAKIQPYGNTDLNPPGGEDALRIITTGQSTWRKNDNASNSGFSFAHRAISGDFQVQVRLSAPKTNAVKWGIEVRKNTNGKSPKLDWGYYKGWNGLQAQNRLGNGNRQNTSNGQFSVPHPANTPIWVRVVKTGNTFRLYYATDSGGGTHGSWTLAKTYTNNMGNNVLVGLFASAYTSSSNPSRLRTFDYNYYRICTAGSNCDDSDNTDGHILYEPTYDGTVDAGWTFTPFGNAATPTPTFSELAATTYTPFQVVNGVIRMDNNGSSTWKLDDNASGSGFLFAYHQISGNFDVQVRLVSECADGNCPPPSNAKFGLEVRASLASAADKLDWVWQYTGGTRKRLQYQYRRNGSRVTSASQLGTNQIPVWLRIVRDGNRFTLYYANDTTYPNPPTQWVQQKVIDTTGMPDAIYLGLINASYSSNRTVVTMDSYHICVNPGGAASCGEVREAAGTVVINAGNYVDNIARNNKQWGSVSRSGKTGLAVPDKGASYTGSSYSTNAPELQYAVDFTNIGKYYIWLLGSYPNTGGNSAYVGLTNSPPPSNNYMTSSAGANQVKWFNTANGANYLNVTAPGPQTISVWMREDGFELYQILLTTDANYDPNSATDPLGITQSTCSAAGVPDPPPGLAQCDSVIVNGNFEDDTLMSRWVYPGISQQVTRTSIPHYFAPGESFSMLLPATTLSGVPRQPWLYQEFQMPTWVLTPTVGGGTSLNLTLHVAINPDTTTPQPDPLYTMIRDQAGQPLDAVSLTGPITVTTGNTPPYIDPNNPSPNNSEWVQKTLVITNANNFNPVNYAGQTLRLFFESPNPDFSYRTRFYVDNVDLQVCTQQPIPKPPYQPYNTKVSGDVRVFINGVPTEKPGVFVWIYAIDGSMEKTYTIQDSTFSFYGLPAQPGGTQYILYAEYWEGGKFYSASTVIVLQPGGAVEGISLLLF